MRPLPVIDLPVISLRGVHAARGGVEILRGVDLHVSNGEAVALFGRNGMGKTTTLDCIAGVLRPGAGTLTVLGRAVTPGKPHRAVRAGLGYVPENRGIFPRLTVGENLAVSRAPGTPWDVPCLLALFPALDGRLRERAGLLSGGQQQMLAIARALSGNPRVLLLDEPTAGLAPLVIDTIAAALSKIAAAGVALLVVEQTMAVAGRVAGRFLFMEDGRVAADVGAAALAADPDLFDRYLGVGQAPPLTPDSHHAMPAGMTTPTMTAPTVTAPGAP